MRISRYRRWWQRLPRLLPLCLLPCAAAIAGERRVESGYAASDGAGGILFSPAPFRATALALPAAPTDRSFLAPSRVRWEIELTGERTAAGVPGARALRTAPDEVAWPAGEEMSPQRFAGSFSGMNPGLDPLDPLGVAPGSGIADYDGDGVGDEADAFPGDPLESADSDHDGLGDQADPDDDNDGIPDSYEQANGLNPLLADATRDLDGDGAANLAEYEAGTRANDARSRFQVRSVTPIPPDRLRIAWDALPGRTYAIFRLSLLSSRPVLVLDGITVPRAGPLEREVPAGAARDFYYLRVLPNP